MEVAYLFHRYIILPHVFLTKSGGYRIVPHVYLINTSCKHVVTPQGHAVVPHVYVIIPCVYVTGHPVDGILPYVYRTVPHTCVTVPHAYGVVLCGRKMLRMYSACGRGPVNGLLFFSF